MELCPFCKIELSKKKNFCFSCNGFAKDALFIDDESRKKSKFPNVKKELILNIIPEFTNILSQNPDDLNNLFNLALAYLNTGSYEDSIKLWERFIEKNPSDSVGLNNLGVCHLGQGKYNYARLALQKAYKWERTSPTIIYNLGTLYRLQGDMEQSIKFYREYDTMRPGNPFIKELLEKHSNIQSFPEYIEENDAMKQTYTPRKEPLNKKSLMVPTDTISLLEAIFKEYDNKDLDSSFNLLANLKLEDVVNQEHKSRLAKILSAKGNRKHKEENHIEAAVCYQNALKMNPNLPLGGKIGQQYFKAGEKLYHLKNFEEAIKYLEEALKWDKTSPAKAVLLQTLKEKIAGIQDFTGEEEKSLLRKLLELEPTNEFASIKLKKAGEKIPEYIKEEEPEYIIKEEQIEIKEKEQEEKPQEVKEKIENISEEPEKEEEKKQEKSSPDSKKKKETEAPQKPVTSRKISSKSFLSAGGILLIVISIISIIFVVKYYIENTGSNARSIQAEKKYYEGLKAEKDGNIDKAVGLIEEAIVLNPDYAEAYNHLGQLYDRKGDQKKALKLFEIARELNIEYAEVYDNLATVSGTLGQEINAHEYRELAREKYRRKSILVRQSIGCYNNNQINIAIDTIKKAIVIDPEDPALHYNIALAYLKSGQIKDTEKELKKAIKIAESRDRKDYVKQFTYVLSNLNSEDLVVDLISYEQAPSPTPAAETGPTQEPSPAETATPVADVSLPPEGEDSQVAAVDTTDLFFKYLNSKDYSRAYSLFSDTWKSQVSEEEFKTGFSSMSNINVSTIRILETTDTNIKVKVYFSANKNSSFGTYEGIYILSLKGQRWFLEEGGIEEKSSENQAPVEEKSQVEQKEVKQPQEDNDKETF